MLMYDAHREVLTPMIYQDAQNDLVRRFSVAMASDFPLRSFELGTTLASELLEAGLLVRLMLLVNDHAFLTSAWKAQQLDSNARGPELRRAFYRTHTDLPRSFHAALAAATSNLPPDVVLRNDDPSRPGHSIVPKRSIYYSEKMLRRHFDNHTWASIKTLPGFGERPAGGRGLVTPTFAPPDGNGYCLANGHGCDCSGEVIELLLTCASKGFGYTVLLVPSECLRAVVEGTRAFIHLPKTYRRELSCVSVAGNIGGMGEPIDGVARRPHCVDFLAPEE